MIEKMRNWLLKLEATINELAETFNQDLKDVEKAWEEFWYDDGAGYDENWEGQSIEIFKKFYTYKMEDEGVEAQDEPKVKVEVVDGINYCYYSYNNTSYSKKQIAELADKIGCRRVQWVRGKNVFRGDLMDIETFLGMVRLYNAYKEA